MKHSKAIRSAFAVWTLGVAFAASAATTATTGTLNLSPDQPNRIRTTPDAAAIQAVPAAFPFAGKDELVIGMTVAWPPLSTYATDEKTVVGADPDLAQLVADGLGRKLKIVVLAWEDWPLAVQSGKVDAVLSNVTVTEARKEKFDFSSYRRDVLGFYVRKASPIQAIREPKDIAGLRVITDSGTNQEKILLEWDKENVAHGLKPVQIQYYGDPAVSFVALQSGRADLILSVNSALAYEAAQKGDLRAVGAISGGWPITADLAITTRKGSGLAAPLTLLLNDLIHSGKYTQVLDRWNLGSEAVNKGRDQSSWLAQELETAVGTLAGPRGQRSLPDGNSLSIVFITTLLPCARLRSARVPAPFVHTKRNSRCAGQTSSNGRLSPS